MSLLTFADCKWPWINWVGASGREQNNVADRILNMIDLLFRRVRRQIYIPLSCVATGKHTHSATTVCNQICSTHPDMCSNDGRNSKHNRQHPYENCNTDGHPGCFSASTYEWICFQHITYKKNATGPVTNHGREISAKGPRWRRSGLPTRRSA